MNLSLRNAYTVDPLSAVSYRLRFFGDSAGGPSAFATGFGLVSDDGTHFLVTNWHNVTGKDSITGQYLTGLMPTTVEITFRSGPRLADIERRMLALYSDASCTEPIWQEHPVHGNAVDVVAIQLPTTLLEGLTMYPLNRMPSMDWDFQPEVSDDVFVLGYPFMAPPPFELAIWKKGSIASEPRTDYDGLPKLLIDTATRPGLSGSPVIFQRQGIHGITGAKLTGKEIIGQIRGFVGVYSGRMGQESMAQLGVVWKSSAVKEIIENGRPGSFTV